MTSHQKKTGWSVKRLNELGFVGRGKSKHRPRNDPSLYGGPFPFIQTGEVKEADLYISHFAHTYNDKGLAQSKLWDPGTLLITIAANIAETAILKIKACFPDSIVGFIADPAKSDVRFVKYSIDAMKLRMQSVSRGTTQDNLSLDKLLSFDFLVPDAHVQSKIAAVLSAYDDLIENNIRRIRILENILRALYNEWFVKFRFPGNENIKTVESEVGPIPEGWVVKMLGDIAQEMRRSVSPNEIEPETPYIGLEHMPRMSIALSEWGFAKQVRSTKLCFKKGEILFGKIRPYFHKVGVAPVDGVCSSDAIVISSKSPEYFAIVLACISSDEFIAHATQTSQGTKMPRANWDVLTKYPVAIPPNSLVSRFDELAREMVDQIQNMVLRNRNLRCTRDLLLPKLISGELDVENLDIAIPESAPNAETATLAPTAV